MLLLVVLFLLGLILTALPFGCYLLVALLSVVWFGFWVVLGVEVLVFCLLGGVVVNSVALL